MSDEDELPAIYRSLSLEGLLRLRTLYVSRKNESGVLRGFYSRRLEFIDEEVSRKNEDLA